MNGKTIIALNYKHLVFARQREDRTWSTGSSSIGFRSVALAVDPHQSDAVYVGTDGHGILKTADYGETWEPIGLSGQIVRAIAISKLRPGTIYAGTKPAHLYVSHDYGEHWRELTTFRQMKRWWWFTPAEVPMSAYVMDIVLSPTDPDVILVGIELGGVLRSADGGETWGGHMKGAVLDCHDLSFHPSDGNWVYAGGGDGGAFSRDGGQTWIQPDPMTLFKEVLDTVFRGGAREDKRAKKRLDRRYGWAVAGDPNEPNIWYLSASTGPGKAHGEGNAEAYIYRCQDGRNWERLSGGLPQPLNHFPYGLLTDIDASGHIYAVLQNGDVWQSEDYGDKWIQLPLNLGSVWYRALMI